MPEDELILNDRRWRDLNAWHEGSLMLSETDYRGSTILHDSLPVAKNFHIKL